MGSVLGYVFYWLLAIAILVYMKVSEGRSTFFGYKTAAYIRHQEAKAKGAPLAIEDDTSVAQAADAAKEGVSEEKAQ